MYRRFFKRFIDFTVSVLLLLILSPIVLALILLLFFANGGKPFFFQERPGFKEKRIRIIKFKSMNDKRDKEDELLPDNLRLTPLGKFVRSTSLDELPQLINVLKGDMSLIGPRPLLFKYLPLYSREQRRRHSVRPGITGWAQVNGRNTIPWKKKFEYDIYYADNISFLLDVKIFWLTIKKIVIREGVNQSGKRPMQPFDGTN